MSSALVRLPTAIPMLAVVVTTSSWGPGSRNGAASTSRIRSATTSGPASSDGPSTRTTNSSPPRRPTVSLSRITVLSRVLTARSSSSPAACPKVSLTALKSSRSRNSTATGLFCRRARASACSSRSMMSARFGSPVSVSWNASCASSSVFSATRRRARARPVASTNISRPISTLMAQPAVNTVSAALLPRIPPPATGPTVCRLHPVPVSIVTLCPSWATSPLLNVRSEELLRWRMVSPTSGRPSRACSSNVDGSTPMPTQPRNAARRAATVPGTTPPV
jgi:hypothetical protein